jgi:hypothetical protein
LEHIRILPIPFQEAHVTFSAIAVLSHSIAPIFATHIHYILAVIGAGSRGLICSSKARRLRCNAVGLNTRRSLRQHQSSSAEYGRTVFVLLLSRLTCLALFVVLAERLDRRRLLAHVADHEWHREVVEVVAPRDLHDDVYRDEVVASIQHADIAFPAANVDKLGAWLALRRRVMER